MIGRTFFRNILLLVALVVLPFSLQAQQPDSSRTQPTGGNRLVAQQALSEGEGTEADAKIDAALIGSSGLARIVIELDAAPTAEVYARTLAGGATLQATRDAQVQLARVEQAQQRLLTPLAGMGATVIYRTQRVYNGIAVHVDSNRLSEIASLPGVKGIHRLARHYPDLESSVPLIGAPELWQGSGALPELTGTGLKVAIIDTGVDYLHTGFDGPGTPAAYTANNTKVITETPTSFPTTRVVAGYDFAGDDYTGDNAPAPDPDPMDCNGHGSHVAGIAAGNGVLDSGAAYTGPYNNPNLYTANNFKIGPGVAPEASIVALRVFGCEGSTELVSEALDWAVDPNGDGNFSDRVDVINMSLGSDFGFETDSTSVASENAIAVGTIVVASAGNDGDSHYITGSPATTARVISVSSSVDATDILDGFRVNSPPAFADVYAASFSVAYDWASSAPVTGTLVYPPTQRSGCQAFTPANVALITGKIVLLDWTDAECGSVARGNNLVAAGAIGGILVDNTAAFDLFITGSAAIPMVSVPKSVGDTLKAALGTGTVSVTLSNEYLSQVPYTDPNLVDTLSAFSSRGPRRFGSALKPDIAAPGQGIFSVGALTGDEGANISGTSMAAPHVAGSMVLMRQLHPTWTVDELKALVMNTAVNSIRSDLPANAPIFPPSRVGAGRIDLPRAGDSSVIAYDRNAPGNVSISFGDVEVFGTATMTRTIRVSNKGASAVTYNLAYVPATTIPGVSYTLSASSVTVPAGGTADVVVTMSATAAQMKHTHDPTITETQQGFGRPWLSEASGHVVMTESGLATSNFVAVINGNQENPPTGSPVTASGVFTYTSASGNIQYAITFAQPITLTMAHFHRGVAGVNGPVVVAIPTGDGTFVAGETLAGNVTIPAPDRPLLLQGGLYVNFHTAAFPGGEIRGQVVPSQAETALRVPVYSTARPASDMRASLTNISTVATPNVQATIPLAGTGVNTGSNYPFDIVSLVSAFELQQISPNEPESNALNNKADLAYVGVASDIAGSSTLTDTTIFFGIATHDDWSTPNELEFNVYIDTDRDGTEDFVLFNSNLGFMTGGDQNDVLYTFLYDVAADDIFLEDYLNGTDPNDLDTAVFNNNVIVLPVFAADLGLTSANSTFNYRVRTLSLDDPGSEEGYSGAIEGQVDQTGWATYNAAQPGLDTTGGDTGTPTYQDLPGQTIPVKLTPIAFVRAGSRGLLLLHHHNRTGDRVEVFTTPRSRSFLPTVRR